MRIAKLQLPAYGHFEDKGINFGKGHPSADFHILYGTNEAGKSTLLRAITELLFGIHLQSRAKFRHGSRIQIRATLEQEGLEPFDFLRRTKRDAPIASPEGTPLPDSMLAPFLHGLDKDLFENSFGISHDRLREGGDELNEGKGDLGQALLSASGIEGIRPLLEEIRAQLKELLSSAKAAIDSFPSLKKQYEEILSELQRLEDEQSADEFGTLCNELVEAKSLLAQAQEEEKEASTKAARLTRIKTALPNLRPYLDRKAELEVFADPICLPQETLDALEKLLTTESQTTETFKQIEVDIAALKKRRETISYNPAYLDCQTQIEAVRDHSQLQEKRTSETQNLERKIEVQRGDIHSQMAGLGWEDDLDAISGFVIPDLQIQEYHDRIQQKESLETHAQTLEGEIQEHETTLANQGAASNIELDDAFDDALTQATKAQSIAESISGETQLLETQYKILEDSARSLPYIESKLGELPTLGLPAKALLQDFDTQFTQAKETQQTAEKALAGHKQKLHEAERKLEAELESSLQADPGQLQRARDYRDKGWQLILEDWKGQGATEELQPGTPLEEAYQHAVQEADHAADHLFENAEKAGRIQQLREDLRSLEKESPELQNALQETQEALDQLSEGWEEAWEPLGIAPGTPSAMLEWHGQVTDLVAKYNEHREKVTKIVHGQQTLESATNALASALGEKEKPLGQLLSKANGIRESKRLVQQTRQQLQAAKEQLLANQKDTEEFQPQWEALLSHLYLEPGATAQQSRRTLEAYQNLFTGYSELQTQQSQLASLQKETGAFQKEVAQLSEQLLGPDLFQDTEATQTARKLSKALQEAREHHASAKTLEEEIDGKQTALEKARIAQDSAKQQLQETCKTHKCNDAIALREFLRQQRQKLAIQEKLEQSRAPLEEQAQGTPLDEFLEELEAHQETIAQEVIEADLDQLARRNASDSARENFFALQNRLDSFSKDAAQLEKLRLQLGDLQARITEKAQHFAQLAWQENFLTSAIQKAREASGGSLLKAASQLFARLTENAYLRLDTETNEKTGQAYLVGIRKAGKLEEPVHPQDMSDGTRDQMYLALRLAWLQENLPNTPVPVVLDDLLINFDDHRSKAILQVLAQLAKTTTSQVLLFTHHYHVLELAREVLEEDKDFQFQDITQDPADPF